MRFFQLLCLEAKKRENSPNDIGYLLDIHSQVVGGLELYAV